MDEFGSVKLKEHEVVLRDYNPQSDGGCVYTCWINQLYYSLVKPTEETPTQIYQKQSDKIKEIIKDAKVKIACLKDDPHVIIGYSVATGHHLNWIYVKSDYRCTGIGTMLFPNDIETVTQDLTRIGAAIVEKKNLKVRGEENGRNSS